MSPHVSDFQPIDDRRAALVPPPAPHRSRSPWWPLALLWVVGGVAVLTAVARIVMIVIGLTVDTLPDDYDGAHYLNHLWVTASHIGPGIVFLVVGPLQFSPSFRRRHPRWHRRAGWVFVVSGLMLGLSGVWMNHHFPAVGGVMKLVSTSLFGVGLPVTLVLAMVCLVKGEHSRHRVWMIRAFGVGMAPATQRILLIPVFLALGHATAVVIDVGMTLGWIINVAVAEWIIQQQLRRTRIARRRGRARTVSAFTTTATVDARFWNRLAETYAAKPVDNPEAFRRKTEVTRALVEPGHTVLDVGCGTGTFCLRLAATGAQVHGLDFSSEMVRIARSKAEGTDDVYFHVGPFDATFTAFGPGSLDGVFAYSLLHLVPDRAAALQRAFDLLRPGGYFVASTVCLGESWVPYTPMLLAMRLIGKAPWVAARLSKSTLHREVKAAGFSDLKTPDVGAAPRTDFLVARKPG